MDTGHPGVAVAEPRGREDSCPRLQHRVSVATQASADAGAPPAVEVPGAEAPADQAPGGEQAEAAPGNETAEAVEPPPPAEVAAAADAPLGAEEAAGEPEPAALSAEPTPAEEPAAPAVEPAAPPAEEGQPPPDEPAAPAPQEPAAEAEPAPAEDAGPQPSEEPHVPAAAAAEPAARGAAPEERASVTWNAPERAAPGSAPALAEALEDAGPPGPSERRYYDRQELVPKATREELPADTAALYHSFGVDTSAFPGLTFRGGLFPAAVPVVAHATPHAFRSAARRHNVGFLTDDVMVTACGNFVQLIDLRTGEQTVLAGLDGRVRGLTAPACSKSRGQRGPYELASGVTALRSHRLPAGRRVRGRAPEPGVLRCRGEGHEPKRVHLRVPVAAPLQDPPLGHRARLHGGVLLAGRPPARDGAPPHGDPRQRARRANAPPARERLRLTSPARRCRWAVSRISGSRCGTGRRRGSSSAPRRSARR